MFCTFVVQADAHCTLYCCRQEMEAMESAVRSACQSGSGAVVCGPIEEEVKTVLRPVGLNTVQLLKACSKGPD